MFIIKESVWAYSLMDKTFGFGKKKKKKLLKIPKVLGSNHGRPVQNGRSISARKEKEEI